MTMLYTDYAAKRITLDLSARIAKITETGAYVITQLGKQEQFIEKKEFGKFLVQNRKARAKQITVEQVNSSRWIAVNTKKQSAYNILALSDRIECNCEDYKNQVNEFGKGCCKHGYKVLNELGFTQLSDYVNDNKKLKSFNQMIEKIETERQYLECCGGY